MKLPNPSGFSCSSLPPSPSFVRLIYSAFWLTLRPRFASPAYRSTLQLSPSPRFALCDSFFREFWPSVIVKCPPPPRWGIVMGWPCAVGTIEEVWHCAVTCRLLNVETSCPSNMKFTLKCLSAAASIDVHIRALVYALKRQKTSECVRPWRARHNSLLNLDAFQQDWESGNNRCGMKWLEHWMMMENTCSLVFVGFRRSQLVQLYRLPLIILI